MPRTRSLIGKLLLLASLLAGGCQPAPPPAPPTEVRSVRVTSLPTDPNDASWEQALEYPAHLIPQDLVDPRQMRPSTSALQVRALTDGQQIAFRLQWKDSTADDVASPAQFGDACAIQLPTRIEPTIPAPQMGEPGRPVEITYWSAVWQASVNGRGDTIQDLFPGATVDHYPFQAASLKQGSPEQREMADRYAPARALHNLMAGPRKSPVQDLLAEGPSTLKPAPSQQSNGTGQRTADGWSVVITRPCPAGFGSQPNAQIAFAVWEGSQGEVGARKMRTGWITLTSEEKR